MDLPPPSPKRKQSKQRKEKPSSPSKEEEAEKKPIIYWLSRSLSWLLRFEQITETEYQLFDAAFTPKTYNQDVEAAILHFVPKAAKPPEKGNKDEVLQISIQFSQTIVAIVYAFKKTGGFDLEAISKCITLQETPLFGQVRQQLYDDFNVMNDNITLWNCFLNPVVMKAIQGVISEQKLDAKKILQVISVMIHDVKLARHIRSLDESPEFYRFFGTYFELGYLLNDPHLYEAIVPPLGGQLQNVSREGDSLFLDLTSEQKFKIRKDIVVGLQITIPKSMQLQIDTKSRECAFVGKALPICRLDVGGIWLGSVEKFRARTREESQSDRKDVETTVQLGYGVSWAMKLFGLSSGVFPVAHSTLWWYFQTIFEDGDSEDNQDDGDQG